MPNIPVGQDRVIELGIFSDGTCDADFANADWYGIAQPVEISAGAVTIVDMVLQSAASRAQTGSVVIRVGSFDSERLHAEIVDGEATPIPGATCKIFDQTAELGSASSGAGLLDLGVIDADVIVPTTATTLKLVCQHPQFAKTVKEATFVPDPADPSTGTFIATVIMKRRVEILTSTTQRLSFRLNVSPLELTTVQTSAGEFQRITELDSGLALRQDESSLPAIPVFPAVVAMPLDGTAKVTVNADTDGATSIVRLYPAQPDFRDPGGPEAPTPEPVNFVFDDKSYARAVTSLSDVRQRSAQSTGDGNFQVIEIPVVDFQPGQNVITQYDSLIVTIDFDGGACFHQERVADGYTMDEVDRRFEAQPTSLTASALNGAILTQATCSVVIRPVFFGARLVIVSAPAFLTAANDLATHKNARGIRTTVVSTATTGTSAASIRTYLQNAYNNWWVRPQWVLLMGDAEFIPTYYPGPNNTWDGVKNGGDQHYGQYGGGDTSVPLVGIGRFPVDTAAQAQAIVDKVKAFESSPPTRSNPFYRHYTFAAMYQDDNVDGTEDRTFARTAEVIRSHVVSKGFTVQRVYADSPITTPTTWYDGVTVPWYLRKPTFPWTGSTTDIVSAFNAGRALFFHRDHGWWTGWGTPSFSTSSLGSVAVSATEYPFVFSVNCSSGIFDNESSETSGKGYSSASTTYWAETFLRKSDGALAVIGDQRSSGSTINSDLAKGMFDAIFPGFLAYGSSSTIRRLGDVLNHGKGYLTTLGYSSSNLEAEMTIYNLLGDPTVAFRTAGPWIFEVSSVVLQNAVLTAQIPPPQESEVCPYCPPDPRSEIVVVVQDAKGTVVGRGFATGDGSVNIAIDSQATAPFVVTASSDDTQPVTFEISNVIR